MKLKKISSVAILILLALPVVALAFTLGDGETPLPNPISDDFYTAGQSITLENPVYGDMMAAGGQIQIEEPVSQDLTLVGGNISIQSEIGDDARIAGGDIRIGSIIKGDLIVGGGSIAIDDEGFVGGDFVFGAGSVKINGTINGNVLGATNELFINSEIKGNVRLMDIEKITFGPNGKVLGDFSYRSAEASPTVTSETVMGKISYSATEVPMEEKDFRKIAWGVLSGFSIFGFLSLLFTGLFFLWAFQHLLIQASRAAGVKILPSLGFGFLIAFATPAILLVLLITGIGLPLSLILLFAWLLILLIGKLVAILMIGMRLVRSDEKSSFPRLYWAFAVGAFIFSLLAMIPVFGWILRLLLNLLGIGALLLVLANFYKSEHKKKIV